MYGMKNKELASLKLFYLTGNLRELKIKKKNKEKILTVTTKRLINSLLILFIIV